MATREKVYWQAHRGGGAYEAPDNTMAANRYAWKLGGIPEADIRTTRDGVIVCLHDATIARTTSAPEDVRNVPVSELDYEQVVRWDAGEKFHESFRGERIPALSDMFEEMRGKPERLAYLDLKQVDLDQLGRLIDEYGVNEQVIFTHHIQENCKSMKRIASGVKTMQWIGGSPERIKTTYRQALESGFEGLDQIQFHLKASPDGEWPFLLEKEILAEALSVTRAAGIDLEVLPFTFDMQSIHLLLDLGIRWYATDEPARFLDCVNSWKQGNAAQ